MPTFYVIRQFGRYLHTNDSRSLTWQEKNIDLRTVVYFTSKDAAHAYASGVKATSGGRLEILPLTLGEPE